MQIDVPYNAPLRVWREFAIPAATLLVFRTPQFDYLAAMRAGRMHQPPTKKGDSWWLQFLVYCDIVGLIEFDERANGWVLTGAGKSYVASFN